MTAFNIKKMAIIIIATIALGFVFSDYIVDIDSSVNNWFSQPSTNGVNLFSLISFLGGVYVISFLSLVLSYFLWKLPLSGSIFLKIFWFTFLCDVATGFVLKNIIGRDRPLGAEIYESGSYSFPSGHSLTSFFFYGFLMFVIFRLTKIDLRKKYFILIFLISLIVLIGISRLYLGVHFLSDVLGGYLIAWFWLNTAFYFMRDIQRERKLNVVKVSS